MTKPRKTAKTRKKKSNVSVSSMAKAAQQLREKSHPYFTYKPTPMCEAASRSKCRHILLAGANGTGKTYGMTQIMVDTLLGNNKARPNKTNSKFMLFCLSRNQGHNVWRELLLGEGASPDCEGKVTHNRGIIPHWEIARKPNGKLNIAWDVAQGRPVPKKITMKNGNTLDFYWHGASHQWEHLQGTAYDAAFIDEAGDETEKLFAEMEMRFREAVSRDGDSAGWVLWGATDTTASEDFERWKELGSDPTNNSYAYFEIPAGDNPIMTEAVLNELASGMSEDEAKIRVYGTATRGDELRILGDFDESIHVMDTPYIPSDSDNVFVVYDPGVSDDSGIMVAHTNPRQPKRLIITKFMTPRGLSVEKDGEILLQAIGKYKMRGIIYDKCGANKREKTSGCRTIMQTLKTFLRGRDIWQNAPCYTQPPGQVKDGILAIIGKLTTILDDGKPALLISKPFDANQKLGDGNGLNKLIRELKNYRKKMNALGKELSTANINQKNNEGPDCLRYLCLMDPHWIDYGLNGSTEKQFDEGPKGDYERQMHSMAERKAKRQAFARKAKRGRARMSDYINKLSFGG